MKMILPMPGGATLEIEGTDEKEIFRQAAFWQGLPSTCPIDDTPVRFEHRTPQDYEYFMLVSTGRQQYEYKLGQKREDGSLFPKGQWTYYDPEARKEIVVWEHGKLIEDNLPDQRGVDTRARRSRDDDSDDRRRPAPSQRSSRRPPPNDRTSLDDAFPPEEDLPFDRAPHVTGLSDEQMQRRAKGLAMMNKQMADLNIPVAWRIPVVETILGRDVEQSFAKLSWDDVVDLGRYMQASPTVFKDAWESILEEEPEAAQEHAAGTGEDLDAMLPEGLLE